MSETNDQSRLQYRLGSLQFYSESTDFDRTTAAKEETIEQGAQALSCVSRDDNPLAWARTQFQLACAFHEAALVEVGAESALQAVAAYRQALNELKANEFPLEWETTQIGLARALYLVGLRQDIIGPLRESTETYRAVLGTRRQERSPLASGELTICLGMALREISERTPSKEGSATIRDEIYQTFKSGVELFRKGFETSQLRSQNPLLWASEMSWYAWGAYLVSEEEDGTSFLEEAASALKNALQIYTPHSHPEDWKWHQKLLAQCLMNLSSRVDSEAYLHEAIAIFESMIQETSNASDELEAAFLEQDLAYGLKLFVERTINQHQIETLVTKSHGLFNKVIGVYRLALGNPQLRTLYTDKWIRVQVRLGSALLTLSEREGDIKLLEDAVAAYSHALENVDKDRAPMVWARLQGRLAGALNQLGQRENGICHLEKAVEAYNAAFSQITWERDPVARALLQNSYGYLLWQLAHHLEGTGQSEEIGAHLNEARMMTQEALAHFPRERAPLDWAMGQQNLSNILRMLGKNNNDISLLEQALAAIRLALEVYTREKTPLDWGMAQSDLGNALSAIGELNNVTEYLRQAVRAFQLGLEERTRERDPIGWARTQYNMGLALWKLGKRENDSTFLQQCVEANQAALLERTRERDPYAWACSETNLGVALSELGYREANVAQLQEAILHYKNSLCEFTFEKDQVLWAITKNNICLALIRIGKQEKGTESLQLAVKTCRLALADDIKKLDPMTWAWAWIQASLGQALENLGRREGDVSILYEAVSAFREALKVRTRERSPDLFAKTQDFLGGTLKAIAQREVGIERALEAIDAFRLSLEGVSAESNAALFGRRNFKLGRTLIIVIQRTDKTETKWLKQCVDAFRAALVGYPRAKFPAGWSDTQHNLAWALKTLGTREQKLDYLEGSIAAYHAALEETKRSNLQDWSGKNFDLATTCATFAKIAQSKTKMDEAFIYVERALEGFRELNKTDMVEKALRLIADWRTWRA